MQVVLLLTIIGAALAVPRNIQRIVGGEETTVDKYPFMSNMQFSFVGNSFFQNCGGSLISKSFVLSAAHCYQDTLPFQWRVLLGTSSILSGGDAHTVSKIIPHAEYNRSTFNNDIALIKLGSFAKINNFTIAAARIPAASYILPDDAPLNIIGWGTIIYVSSGDGVFCEQLRHVEVRSINQKICVERYAYLQSLPTFEYIPDVTKNMLCAGILDVGGKDACQGDSGGPVAHAGNIIVGVTSWGHECANATYPGVNARVSAYTNWIKENAK